MGQIRAVVGEGFEVVLESVAGTGFRWEALVPEGKGVVLVEEELEGSAPGRVGGSVRQRFRFEAGEPGKLELRFVYRRPWESEPPLEERVFSVRVEPE